MALNVKQVPGGLIISVKVVPNASREQIVGLLGDALKIKVAQPPEDGRANRAVERLLAAACGLPPRNIQVVEGLTQPHKRVLLRGATVAHLAMLCG